ncbi:hypothetical protein NMG60_11016363 [Bertholletia excelsa]
MGPSEGLISKIYNNFSSGVHFAAPVSSLRTNEIDLVRSVLHILQGLSSSLFYWDNIRQSFHVKSGIYVSHLSQTSLHGILNQFSYAATCLKLVENVVNKVEISVSLPLPTLRAFTSSVSAWLKRLRDIALKEEVKISTSDGRNAATLLGLANSLSSLCSGAEYLFQIVHGAIPKVFFEQGSSIPAAEIAVHILDHLYKKLNEICPVNGGEEDAYRMLLYIFVGSLLPYIEGLDSWLFEGSLDDPFDEMFFYANKAISVNESDFWEKSYLLRQMLCQKPDVASAINQLDLEDDKKEMTGRESISVSNPVKGKEQNNRDIPICPLFIKEIATSIVSAGKSLQLIQHSPMMVSVVHGRGDDRSLVASGCSNSDKDLSKTRDGRRMAGLSLSEVFCVSLAGLIGNGDHLSEYCWQDELFNLKNVPLFQPFMGKKKLEEINSKNLPAIKCSEKFWYKILVEQLCTEREFDSEFSCENKTKFLEMEKNTSYKSFFSENPVITVCHSLLSENKDAWGVLRLSKNFFLPPLNDEGLRNAIFGGKDEPSIAAKGTQYAFGFQFDESHYLHSMDDTKMLEELFPFPTLLPSFQVLLDYS